MFEHFGLKDVFYVLRKNIKYLLLLWLAVIIIGGTIGFATGLNARSVKAQSTPSDGKTYVSSATYYISVSNESTKNELVIQNNSTSESQKMLLVYKSLLSTDFCRQYVYNKVMELYTPEEFLEKSGIKQSNPSAAASDVTAETVSQLTTINQVGETSLLNLFAQTPDQNLSKAILNAYMGYIKEEAPQKITDAKVQFVGGANQLLEGGMDANGQVIHTESSLKRNIKYILAAMAVAFAFFCIVVFVYALCFPTLNRKSDFEVYQIPVIAEVPESLGEKKNESI